LPFRQPEPQLLGRSPAAPSLISMVRLVAGGACWAKAAARLPNVCSRVVSRPLSAPATPSKDCVQIAVVGAGPAGFYTAHQILKQTENVKVDIYERLPVPFGLARFGVAPDHPEVKNCNDTFTKVAENERCQFFGGVSVGDNASVAIDELRDAYSGVVLSYGCAADNALGVPGEDLDNVFGAKDFVGWYNGLPECQGLAPKLDCKTAIVVGQGNVALDCARMLLSPVDELAKTDITSAAVEALRASKIEQVLLVGRRGPLDVAFTIKELRELSTLPGCYLDIDQSDLNLDEEGSAYASAARPRKRLTDLMAKVSNKTNDHVGSKHCNVVFRRSPTAILESDTEAGRVGAVALQVNVLEGNYGSQKAIGTDESHVVPCGLVIKSIGYKGLPIAESVPFSWGTIDNNDGRVADHPGLYCSGWIKTGPTGVIATTMTNAFGTAGVIVEDISGDVLGARSEDASQTIMNLLAERDVKVVSFGQWITIDEHEQATGKAKSKPREKVTSTAEMLELAGF